MICLSESICILCKLNSLLSRTRSLAGSFTRRNTFSDDKKSFMESEMGDTSPSFTLSLSLTHSFASYALTLIIKISTLLRRSSPLVVKFFSLFISLFLIRHSQVMEINLCRSMQIGHRLNMRQTISVSRSMIAMQA
jgi:hypothetical protein